MTRPTPRRPASSRAATPRPRRIAGGHAPESVEPQEDAPETEGADADEPPPPDPWPVEGPEDDGDGSLLNSPRLTRVLLAVAAVIALVLVAEAAWAIVGEATEDDPEPVQAAEGGIAVPEDRPVLPTELVVQEGVEAAAKAAEKIVNRTFQDYDQEVDEATALMTDEFAEEYRQTTDDVRDEFIRRRTTVQVRVVGQGVVRANDTELQALVFLNQYVIRAKGDDAKTTYTPYRALLTMVNTEDGWLVDELQTE
jgi:Mce-associated membrane protein